jgi:uncharacterized SAM-dependent methyltransferase
MNKKQETELMEVARKVRTLRDSATKADSLIRSWAKHSPKSNEIYVALSDMGNSRWYVGTDLSAEIVQNELIPILRRIRDKAIEEIGKIEMPGRE